MKEYEEKFIPELTKITIEKIDIEDIREHYVDLGYSVEEEGLVVALYKYNPNVTVPVRLTSREDGNIFDTIREICYKNYGIEEDDVIADINTVKQNIVRPNFEISSIFAQYGILLDSDIQLMTGDDCRVWVIGEKELSWKEEDLQSKIDLDGIGYLAYDSSVAESSDLLSKYVAVSSTLTTTPIYTKVLLARISIRQGIALKANLNRWATSNNLSIVSIEESFNKLLKCLSSRSSSVKQALQEFEREVIGICTSENVRTLFRPSSSNKVVSIDVLAAVPYLHAAYYFMIKYGFDFCTMLDVARPDNFKNIGDILFPSHATPSEKLRNLVNFPDIFLYVSPTMERYICRRVRVISTSDSLVAPVQGFKLGTNYGSINIGENIGRILTFSTAKFWGLDDAKSPEDLAARDKALCKVFAEFEEHMDTSKHFLNLSNVIMFYPRTSETREAMAANIRTGNCMLGVIDNPDDMLNLEVVACHIDNASRCKTYTLNSEELRRCVPIYLVEGWRDLLRAAQPHISEHPLFTPIKRKVWDSLNPDNIELVTTVTPNFEWILPLLQYKYKIEDVLRYNDWTFTDLAVRYSETVTTREYISQNLINIIPLKNLRERSDFITSAGAPHVMITGSHTLNVDNKLLSGVLPYFLNL